MDNGSGNDSGSARQLRALLDASPDAALLLRADGTVLALNAIAARELRRPSPALIGRNIFDVLGRDVADERRRAFERAVRDGLPVTHEDRASGAEWSITMMPVRAEDGAVESVAVFARDVTQERRTAHDLRLQATALTAAANSIVITDPEGRIQYVNPAFSRMTGYAPEEVLGQTPRVLKSGAHEPGFYADLWRTVRAGDVWRGEMVNRRKDGSSYPEEQTITPVRAADGAIAHLVAIKQDISESRAARDALRRTDEYFRALIEEAMDLIAVVDENGRFRYVSPSFERVLGYPPAEMIGRNAFEYVHEDDLQALLEVFAATTRKPGQTATAQYRYRHRDGSWRVLESVGRNLIHDPVVRGAIINSRDVTDRKVAEEGRQRLQAQLVQSEKLTAMGALLAGVAHELNNPLAVVIGHTALLQKASDEPTRVRAGKIADAAARCGRIVKNFLALARQHAPERERTGLDTVVRDAVELVAYPLRVDNVEVVFDLPEEVPFIWADAHQLQQVVVNLVTNAHQAMRGVDGPRRLTLTTRPEPGGRVSLTVADTGPGIPANAERRLFEPFFTTKALGEGTGLGLPICKGIVERHGGLITVEPGVGRGATFRVELPIGTPEKSTTPPSPVARVRPCTVLVVDDEPEVGAVVAEILATDGHSVDQVDCGAMALEAVARRRYDAIFSDIKMPGLDGPGLYREIRRRDPDLTERIVFLTGDTLSANTRAFLEETHVDSVTKPFSADDVRAVLGRLVAGRRDTTAAVHP